jgi:YebC/PmpR family DNA-binding regulatory protein
MFQVFSANHRKRIRSSDAAILGCYGVLRLNVAWGIIMSGHSKWSTIKRQKGAADAKRGQLFTKLAREISIAARQGLPDPEANTRLRLAVDRARAANMPKDNIERAIQRASGFGAAEQFEEVYYEGYGPGGAALMIQAQTDNRNRTVSEVRAVLTRGGGSLGENGSVSWMFDQMGVIEVPVDSSEPDEVALLAIDAGASDVEFEGGIVVVYTAPGDLHRVREGLLQAGTVADAAQLTMRPKTTVAPEPDIAVKVIRLAEKLEELDDVQEVFTNVDVSDEVLAAAL